MDILTYGQSVIHPEETGRWVRHIYQKAWAAQSDTRYTATQRSQILAFAYGYLTHAAGDMWAHTLINEYAEGVFPAVFEALSDTEKLEIALRHIIMEGYIGQANAGFDNNPDRTRLPDGDDSDDSTPGRNYGVPTQFVYETLVNPFANTPVNACNDALDDDFDGVLNDGCPASIEPPFDPNGDHSAYDDADPNARDGEHGSPLDGAEVKRGPLIDYFVFLRASLEVARAKYRDDRNHQDCALIDPDCYKRTVTRTIQTVRGRMSYDFTRNVCEGATVGCLPDPSDTLDVSLDALVITYLNAWIKDIDDGLKAWSELGHALTQAMFDPQARRDAQNFDCRNCGADSADPETIRSKCEDRIGPISVVMFKAKPFITNHLLSMAGAPDFVGGGIEVLDGLSEIMDDILGPTLNPLRMVSDEINEFIQKKLYEEVNRRFGVDLEAAVPFFKHASNWLTVDQPITLRLFTNRQHQRVDQLLQLPPNHHVETAPPHNVSYIFPNGLPASTRLADGVSIDPMNVAPIRNTITTARLLLLDGAELNRALGSILVAQGVIKSADSVKTYRAAATGIPANIMIDGLATGVSGASAQYTWLKSIDSDHAWRQDGLPVFCDANPNPATPEPEDGICIRSAANPSRVDGLPTTRLKFHTTDTEWENGSHGNFPVWESCLLRPAFRGLARRWNSDPALQQADALRRDLYGRREALHRDQA